MNRLVFLLLFLWVSIDSSAQNILIKNIEFHQGDVIVTYVVEDSVVGRFYTVRMYSSHDDFMNPLQQVTGEIGLEIKPGGERRVVWKAAKEFGQDFTGNVAIELRARVYIPFINTDWFADVHALRRKHKYHVTWRGGRDQNIMNFDLYKGDQKITTFANIANVGHYPLVLASSIKPGKGYRFRISDTKNKDEVVYTPYFRIKRKFPFFLTHVLPGLVVGGGIYYLTQLGATDPDLPDPSMPPNAAFHDH